MSILRWPDFGLKSWFELGSGFNCRVLIFVGKLIGSILIHVEFRNKFDWSFNCSAVWKFKVAAVSESFN